MLFAAVASADAATLRAIAAPSAIGAGETASVEVFLDLAPGEDASVFEGRFTLVGDGTTVVAPIRADLVEGGPTWSLVSGGVAPGSFSVALLSNNTPGSRLVATLVVTGAQTGTFEVRLAPGTFAERDIASPPFLAPVPIDTPVGTTLAAIDVAPVGVPGPSSAVRVALAIALAGVACRRLARARNETPSDSSNRGVR